MKEECGEHLQKHYDESKIKLNQEILLGKENIIKVKRR
jgi:hypothetical protein